MSIKCPKCQTDNPDTQSFCGDCGTQLGPSKDIPSITKTLETPIQQLTIGTLFANRYEIQEILGKGGMGEVYRVKDKKLDEEMALKVLKSETAVHKEIIERFKNELKLARKITHRNVCRMHDLNEEEEIPFITMEYVKGEDLKRLIKRKEKLSEKEAITLAKQVCEGLVEAHSLGVIHRDLKPQNIMVDDKGVAKVMDFGIARSVEAAGVTQTGVMIGTPDYMSPEQTEGEEADQRSDIYAYGVILYEMVTGSVPFKGDTAFSVALKHKSKLPSDPKKLNPDISENLSRLILICMEKERERRYQTAEELLVDLHNIEEGLPLGTKIRPRSATFTQALIRKKLLFPALVISVVIIAVIVWQLLLQKVETPIPLDTPSIAVLPFIDLSPQKDQEYFCDGMTDEITAKLSRLDEWKVIPRTSVRQYKDTDKDIKEIGKELNVATVLDGSVRKEEDDIRVTATLINVEDGFQLWSDIYGQKLESVFVIQSEIAEKIVEALEMELSLEEKKQLKRNPTENLESYNLYLKGRWSLNKRTEEGIEEAIKYFKDAVEKDANYALAYVGLADCYWLAADYMQIPSKETIPRAKAAAIKALEIDETLSEAYTSLAAIKLHHEWDWEGARRDFERAIQLNPNYGTAHQWYANCLTVLERLDESIVEAKRARELDPLSPIINRNVGRRLYLARNYDQAIEESLKALRIAPDFFPIHGTLGLAYLQKAMFLEAIAELQKAVSLSGGNLDTKALLGYAYAISGNQAKAQMILNDFMERSKERHIPSITIAVVYIGLGDNDQAIKWLEKAYEEGSHWLVYLKANPIYDTLRSDPHFKALLKRMNLD